MENTIEQIEETKIGTMTLIDDSLWCNYAKKVITIPVGWDSLIALADNTIYMYDEDHCELEGHCFNFNCKYNHDRNVSFYKENVDDVEWTDENIKKIQEQLEIFTDVYSNDEEIMEYFSNGNPVINSGYEFKEVKGE